MFCGLYLAQTSLNLFIPGPKTGSALIAGVATCMVAERVGLTSVFTKPSFCGKRLPINWADMKKKREIITIAKENAGKLNFLSSASAAREKNEILYTKMTKAKIPSTSHTST